jgi:AraC-like DNA-binding protein
MLHSVLLNLQFSAGIVLFSFALLQFGYKNRDFLNYNLAGLFFCLAYIIFNTWIFGSGSAYSFRILLHLDIAVAFALGPFAYFYLRTVTGGSIPCNRVYAINFIPTLAAFAGIIAVNAADGHIAEYYKTHSPILPYTAINPFLYCLDLLSNISILIYVGMSITSILPVLRNRNNRAVGELRFIIVYMTLVAISISVVIGSLIAERYHAMLIAIYVLTILSITYFFFCFRSPEFTQKAIREGRLIRDDASPLNPEDSAAVISRVDSLMREQMLFTDENLSIRTLSETMMIPQHVLSKAINESLGMNFRSYINILRVNEAKRLLIENPGMSVLEIAFKTGFNSKSSFNQVFLKQTGQSPREFRAGE